MTTTETDNGIFDLFVGMKAHLGRVTSLMEREEEAEKLARRAEAPRFIRIHGQVVIPASGIAQMGFDNAGPDQGWYWSLRRLVVFDNNVAPIFSTPAAGTADVFVTRSNMVPSQLDWVDHAASIPLFANYANNECILEFTEQLIVQFSGATVGHFYVATGLIVQYQEAAVRQIFER